MSTYFLGPDLTLFSYHVIKRVCTYIIIVEMCLGGFEGNEDRVIGGDGRWAQSVTAGKEHKTREMPARDWRGPWQQWVEGGGGVGVGVGGYRWRRSKPGWKWAKSSARGNSSGWQQLVYQSTIEHTHSYNLCHHFFPLSLTSNCRSRPAPLAWMVAKAVALTPELGPLATEENPHRAVCQGLLIWARWVRIC